MNIYVIGPSGSGKTTLSKKLSHKYNIPSYELDCLVYDDENNHIKRTDKEIKKLFDDITKTDSWIIEDVGRPKFEIGLNRCDTIYYLKISRFIVYKRVIKRWFKQRIGKEKYNYPPTLYQFYDMLKVARNYYKKENEKLEKLKTYSDKVVYINNKELKDFNK